MNIQDWFKGRKGQSLDELLELLIVLKDPDDPDNIGGQARVLATEVIDGILYAQYLHEGKLVKKPVSFYYKTNGSENRFSLSGSYQRVPPKEGSVVITLTTSETGRVPVNIDPQGNTVAERYLHLLGVKVDAENILPMFIYNKGNSSPVISLLAEPDYNCLTYVEDDVIKPIEKALEPIQIAQFRHQYSRINTLKAGFFAGRDFAVKLRQVLEKGGGLDDVVATVERGIPPQYRRYMAQDDMLVKFALRAGMFSHPIHVFKGLSSYAGFSYAGFNELGQRINEFVRAYALPIAGVGISLVLFLNVVAHAVRVNYTEQPEPSRIRSKISAIPQELLEKQLEPLKPYSCLTDQFILPDKDKSQFKGDFHEKSIVFYETLRARGYFPAPYAMRALRALNRGRSYELGLDAAEEQEQRILKYIADPYQPQFVLVERRIGKASSKPIEIGIFMMDQDGVVDYIIDLKPENYICLVYKPHNSIYRNWLRGGYQWEDVGYLQILKNAARKLEEIARNPNYNLLRPVK